MPDDKPLTAWQERVLQAIRDVADRYGDTGWWDVCRRLGYTGRQQSGAVSRAFRALEKHGAIRLWWAPGYDWMATLLDEEADRDGS